MEDSKQLYLKYTYLHGLFERKLHKYRHGHMQVERGQGRVLALLKKVTEISTSELADILDMRQQSLNELLQKLEKKGYVIRRRSDKDRRVMLVQITESGQKLDQQQSDYSVLFEVLNEEEQEHLDDYLTRMIDALKEKGNSFGFSHPWMDFETFEQMMNHHHKE